MSGGGGFIEYLPGVWLTPAQCRAKFAGGPVISTREAEALAEQLERVAAHLREAAQLGEVTP